MQPDDASVGRMDRARRSAMFRFQLRLWWRARLMPLRLRGRSLEQVLQLAEASSSTGHLSGLSPEAIADRVRRTVRHPFLMRDRRCLREGLLTYRLLVETGWQPLLHFGVEPGTVSSARVRAHCWVTLEGRTVIGASDIPYVEILVHPARHST